MPKIPMVYVASSWKNDKHPDSVDQIRAAGFQVYDYRTADAFSWRDIDPDWDLWTPSQTIDFLDDPIAHATYAVDKKALDECDALVLLEPAGKSSHLEAGFVAGTRRGKLVIIVLAKEEPELMYKMADKLVLTQGALKVMEEVFT